MGELVHVEFIPFYWDDISTYYYIVEVYENGIIKY